MSDVPKFVRQRAAQQAPGDHPDANLLSAFAEGGLTKGEHAQVLAHLGACAACRDVVSLALPEVPAAAPAPAQAERQWLRWPMLRWAGAAAAVIVVAAAVVVVGPHRTAPENVKQTTVAQGPEKPAAPKRESGVADSAEKPAAPKPQEAPAAAASGLPARSDDLRVRNSSPVTARKEEFKAKALRKEDAAGAFASKDAASSREFDRFVKSNEAAQLQGQAAADKVQSQVPKVQSQVPAESAKVQSQVPAAPPPVAPSTGIGGSQVAGAIVGQSGQQQSNAPQSRAAMRDQSVQVDGQSQAVAEERAKQQRRPIPQQAENVEVTAAAPTMTARKAAPAPMAKAMLRTGIPRWRLSSEGAVESSTDGGRTWQTVPVAAESVIFRSVSSVDHDVWAGGAGGALYHSADDGRTWTRVTVKALDMVLATDIARVEFTDAQHGIVTTASGVAWTTSDAGATWSVRAKPPM